MYAKKCWGWCKGKSVKDLLGYEILWTRNVLKDEIAFKSLTNFAWKMHMFLEIVDLLRKALSSLLLPDI